MKPQLHLTLSLEAGSYELTIGPHPTIGCSQVTERFTGSDGAVRSKAAVIKATDARRAIVSALADMNVAAAGLLGDTPLTGEAP